jgi:response regulator RpfG family c-di-GMP phosphodiesterase
MSARPSILFVDDEEMVLAAIRRHFLDDEYDVLSAGSGKEGLAILEHAAVDVVVSDFRMPEMDGGEFLRRVNERWPDTVRIVLSGYADISSVISAINEGAIFRFITKPWKETELKDGIRDALEKRRTAGEMLRLAEQALAETQCLFEDERRQSQEMLQRNLDLEPQVESLERYRDAFHSAAVPMLIVSAYGQLIEINRSARDLTGEIAGSDHSPTEVLTTVLADVSLLAGHHKLARRDYDLSGRISIHRTAWFTPIRDGTESSEFVVVLLRQE